MTMEQRIQPFEQQKEPMIGQDVYDITEVTNANPREFYITMQKGFTPEIAKSLESRFHNNSAVSGREKFGDKRPLSAYFTELNGELLIEWGEIDPTGEAKLHDFLNRKLDIFDRKENGAIVRSGHLGDITLPFTDDEVHVALIDRLCSLDTVSENSEDFNMVVAMINHTILPVTSDGYPVTIKEFINE